MADFIYSVRTGAFGIINAQGEVLHLAQGYSGKQGVWRNNPEFEQRKQLGPIPRGVWSAGNHYDSSKTGPMSIPLRPLPATKTYNRSGFLIHGDNSKGDASTGCIILPPDIREQIRPMDFVTVID